MTLYGNILKVLVLSIVFGFSSQLLARDSVPLFSGNELFEIIDAPFKKGDRQTVVEFEVNRGQSFFASVVIPITNVHFELLDSNGNSVLDSHHESIKISYGDEIEPGLPGAMYELPPLEVGNRTGTWKFIIQYDDVNYDSIIALQVFKRSILNAKVAILSHLAVVGDFMLPAILVTANGQPVLNAEVPITVTYPDGRMDKLVGYDDGSGLGAVAGDGVYTAPNSIPYQQVGEHIVESKVVAHRLGYQYQAYAGKNMVVTEQVATVDSVQVVIPNDVCVNDILVTVNATFHREGTFDLYGMLKGSFSERHFDMNIGDRFQVAKGENEFKLTISREELSDTFSVPGEKLRKSDGPYIIRSLLFYGNGMGKNKMLRQLGKSKPYKKELFIPAAIINISDRIIKNTFKKG